MSLAGEIEPCDEQVWGALSSDGATWARGVRWVWSEGAPVLVVAETVFIELSRAISADRNIRLARFGSEYVRRSRRCLEHGFRVTVGDEGRRLL